MLQDFFNILRLSKPNHFMLPISQYLDSKKMVSFPKNFISNSRERFVHYFNGFEIFAKKEQIIYIQC